MPERLCFSASFSISNPAQSAQWGTDWASVPEEHMRTKEFFALLATYLVEEYIIEDGRVNAGKKLSEKVALGLWRGLVQQSKQRFLDSESKMTEVCLARSARALMLACTGVACVPAPAEHTSAPHLHLLFDSCVSLARSTSLNV